MLAEVWHVFPGFRQRELWNMTAEDLHYWHGRAEFVLKLTHGG